MFLRLHLADLEDAKEILPNYFGILNGERRASYLRCREVAVEGDLSDREKLRDLHDHAVKRLRAGKSEKIPKISLLDLKLKLAREMLASCELCERRCRANRIMGKEGHCGVVQSRISSEFVHWGEEPELIPSHTIFFAGCTFNCVFCQNWDISQNPKHGTVKSPKRVAQIMERRSESTKNTNWVGGDPTSNLPFILETLTFSKVNTPQVWNSNMYLTERTMQLLDGIVDVYLTDFKYGNSECAKRLSKVENYWEIITRNHKTARAQCEMIIRHLVLPGHFECCTKPILDFISENLPRVRVNVMDQFHPDYNAYDYRELSARLDKKEFEHAKKYALDLGLSLTD